MTSLVERPPAEWFTEAARCYVAGHQACAWCGASHCVFQTEHGTRSEFLCNRCDFYVCHDSRTNQYHATSGTARLAAKAS